jgi:D-galactose 1-dehydrogenase
LAIVGFGKIARERHVPAIAATPGMTLVAVADPNPPPSGVPHFRTLEDLLRAGPEIDAIALCTPPVARRALAAIALYAEKHVLLEKPPGAAVSEIAPLLTLARTKRRSLFATWHSRFAPAVEPARRLLAGRRILAVNITWKEDVRMWHPGQDWIFEPGGFGAFDPGINALSILTYILPQPLFVTRATLDFPANREAPIAAELELADDAGLPIRASFDFRESRRQIWDIHFETDRGGVTLSAGGRRLLTGDEVVVDSEKQEYPQIYRRFVELAGERSSDVDLAPLQLVADAFMLGRRRLVEAF